MPMRLLCLGDLHLGRRPQNLPDRLDELDLSASELTPARGWSASVEWAIRHNVDAVLLAGDVVESENRYFEALGPLERGVHDLRRAGIAVLAVAGNHDSQVLDRFADSLEGFHLLGRRGTWESTVLRRADQSVRVWGWSFPSRRYEHDPTVSLPAEPDGTPSVGLLHCHLDVSSSGHAPTTRRALASLAPVAWLLGHIHKPDELDSSRPIGYLGSVVGLDPTETGRHGPWLLEVDRRGEVQIEQLPLSPLRWEVCELDVATVRSEDDFRHAVARTIRELHDRLGDEIATTRAVGVTLRLVGRSSLHRRLRRPLRELEAEEVIVVHDETAYAIVQLVDLAAPRLDLERIATGRDPAGLLARRLNLLDGPPCPERSALIEAAQPALGRAAESGVWDALDPVALDDVAVVATLRRAGLRVLEDLLAQVTDGTSSPTTAFEQGDLF